MVNTKAEERTVGASSPDLTEIYLRDKVELAVNCIRQVLEFDRTPVLPEDVSHLYTDKYHLLEFLTNAAVQAVRVPLEALSLPLERMSEWHREGHRITLCFSSEERCTYLNSVTQTQRFGSGPTDMLWRRQVVTTITEYLWEFSLSYSLIVYPGSDKEAGVVLLHEPAKVLTLKTATRELPHPATRVPLPVEVDLTWWVAHAELRRFSINRGIAKCRTPTRNPDVSAAGAFFRDIVEWCQRVVDEYFFGHIFVAAKQGIDKGGEQVTGGLGTLVAALDTTEVFTPVVPLFEHCREILGDTGEALVIHKGPGSAALFSPSDLENLLKEQNRQMAVKAAQLEGIAVPETGDPFITSKDSRFLLQVALCGEVGSRYAMGVSHMEQVLRRELVTVLGKEVGVEDFGLLMQWHAKKVFFPEAVPRPVRCAVRTPPSDPSGYFSLYSSGSQVPAVSAIKSCCPDGFSVPLSHTTSVRMAGPVHLHCITYYKFVEQMGDLVAHLEAKPFGGYIAVLGKVSGAALLQPSHAVVVRDAATLRIPLLLEEIPSAQEFKEAIESLSQEQRSFAKAYRAMQLEATLFAVGLIEIRPQMEGLLNLPQGALQKEIFLTEQLTDLLTQYQVPSELLDVEKSGSAASMVAEVQRNVDSIMELIRQERAAEHEEQEQKRKHEEQEKRRKQAARQAALEELQRAQVVWVSGDRVLRLQDSLLERDGELCEISNKRVSVAAPVSAKAPGMFSRIKSSVSSAADSIAASASSLIPGPGSTPARGNDPGPVQPSIRAEEHRDTISPAGEPPEEIDSQEAGSVPEENEEDERETPLEEKGFCSLRGTFEEVCKGLCPDACVRPIVIKVGETWCLDKKNVGPDLQGELRDTAFALLDSLSKSGAVPLQASQTHLVMASSHCFANSVIDTAVFDNVDPLAKAEAVALATASVVLSRSIDSLRRA